MRVVSLTWTIQQDHFETPVSHSPTLLGCQYRNYTAKKKQQQKNKQTKKQTVIVFTADGKQNCSDLSACYYSQDVIHC